MLSLLLYCKGVYSDFKNTKSARCSSECSNIDFVTNLFSSFKSLREAIFRPFWSSLDNPDSVGLKISIQVQAELRSVKIGRCFWSDFFAGKIIMLTFRFFYEKIKIVFLVKYRYRVRNFPGNRYWHSSHGMNAMPLSKL